MKTLVDEAEINGIRVHYRVYGQGEPLLLIMGLSGNADWWGDYFLKTLAERFQVIAFDNRGAGRTTQAEGPYSILQMSEDTLGLMDHLGLESANVMGASMGGMIAQELTLNHPERVKRLVLMCTFCGGEECVQASPEVLSILAMPRKGLSDEDILRASLVLLFPQEFIDKNPELMDAIVQAYMIAPIAPNCFMWQVQAVAEWSDYSRLKNLRQPTLIITGDQDILIPPQNSRILFDAIPDSSLLEVPGGGHGVQAMYPEKVITAILDFLG